MLGILFYLFVFSDCCSLVILRIYLSDVIGYPLSFSWYTVGSGFLVLTVHTDNPCFVNLIFSLYHVGLNSTFIKTDVI